MPTLVDGQQIATLSAGHRAPLCGRQCRRHNVVLWPADIGRGTYGKGGATLPFSVGSAVSLVTNKMAVEPVAGGDRRLVQNLILWIQ